MDEHAKIKQIIKKMEEAMEPRATTLSHAECKIAISRAVRYLESQMLDTSISLGIIKEKGQRSLSPDEYEVFLDAFEKLCVSLYPERPPTKGE